MNQQVNGHAKPIENKGEGLVDAWDAEGIIGLTFGQVYRAVRSGKLRVCGRIEDDKTGKSRAGFTLAELYRYRAVLDSLKTNPPKKVRRRKKGTKKPTQLAFSVRRTPAEPTLQYQTLRTPSADSRALGVADFAVEAFAALAARPSPDLTAIPAQVFKGKAWETARALLQVLQDIGAEAAVLDTKGESKFLFRLPKNGGAR